MPENKNKIDPTKYPKSEQEGADEENDLANVPQSGLGREDQAKPSKTDDLREDELEEGRREDADDEVTSRQPRVGE